MMSLIGYSIKIILFGLSYARKLYEIKEKVTESLTVSQNAIDELKQRENLSNQLLEKQNEHIRYL